MEKEDERSKAAEIKDRDTQKKSSASSQERSTDYTQPPLGLVYIAVLCVGIFLFCSTWPLSLWLTFTVTIWGFTRKSNHPLLKSIAKTAFPFLWGIAAVMLLQIYLNSIEIEAFELHAIEVILLELKDRLPAWTDFKFWQLCLIIALLLGINILFPRLAAVKHFFWATKLLSNIAAIFASMTCFTFFSSEVISQPTINAERKLIAQIADLRDKRWRESLHVLAIHAVTEQFSEMNGPTQAALRATAQSLTQRPNRDKSSPQVLEATNIKMKRHLLELNYDTDELLEEFLKLRLKNDLSLPPLPSETFTSENDHSSFDKINKMADLFRIRSTEISREAEIKAEEQEARAALDAVLSDVTNGLATPAKNLIKNLASNFLAEYSGFLISQVSSIASATASAYIDRLRKPLINHLVNYGMRSWEPLRTKNPLELAHEVMSRARDACVNTATELLSEAKEKSSTESLKLATKFLSLAKEIDPIQTSDSTPQDDLFEHEVQALTAEIGAAREPVRNAEIHKEEGRKQREILMRTLGRPGSHIERPHIR